MIKGLAVHMTQLNDTHVQIVGIYIEREHFHWLTLGAKTVRAKRDSICDWLLSVSYPDEPVVSASGCSGAGQQN